MMRRGEYDVMLRVFICGENYLLFELSEFLWIDVVGVKKEVTQRSEPHGPCITNRNQPRRGTFESILKSLGF